MFEYPNPFEVSDFGGGITDLYFEGPINQAKEIHNFRITENNRLVSRPGTSLFTSDSFVTPIARIQDAIRVSGYALAGRGETGSSAQLFFATYDEISYCDDETGISAATQIESDYGTSLFPTTGRVYLNSYKEFIVTSFENHYTEGVFSGGVDDAAYPILRKPIKVVNGGWNTMGLPSPEVMGAIRLANDLLSKFNAHLADTAAHTTAADTDNVSNLPSAYDEESLRFLIIELTRLFTAHEEDAQLGSGWSYHAAQGADTYDLDDSAIGYLAVLDDLKTKFNSHDADDSSHGTASNNQCEETRDITVTGNSGSVAFVFGICYKYTQTIGGKTYTYRSPVYLKQVTDVIAESDGIVSGMDIDDIPTLGSSDYAVYPPGDGLFATTKLYIEIYRTTDGGDVLYFMKEIENGTTGFSSASTTVSMKDEDAQLRPTIYTNGGILDNDPPPPCKFVAFAGNTAMYANIYANGLRQGSTFRISKPNEIEAVPASFEETMNDDITGVNSIDTYFVTFTEFSHARIEGGFDALGRGSVIPRYISYDVGTLSHKSIVRIPYPKGLVFFGNQGGFYFTDGYRTTPISTHLRDRLKDVNSSLDYASRVHGYYDGVNNVVKWCLRLDSSSDENDTIFVLDIDKSIEGGGLRQQSTFFTEGPATDSWKPTCIVRSGNKEVICDSRGYLFKYDDSKHADPIVDTTDTPDNWYSKHVPWEYISCAYDFGIKGVVKHLNKFTLQTKSIANSSIDVRASINNSNWFRSLRDIRLRSNINWGDPHVVWGDAATRWNVSQQQGAKRNFPAGSLKATHLQIKFTNAFTNIYRSDDFATVDVVAASRTATLTSGTFSDTDLKGYKIYFDSDDYATGFEIDTATTTQLTLIDPDGDLADLAGAKWLIKGYPKNERLNITSYSVVYAYISTGRRQYRQPSGENE